MATSRALSIEIVLATERRDDRDTLAMLLGGSPWDLVNVLTAQEARAALRRVKFPILVCDPSIGGDQGERVLRALSAARRGTYVVLLTDPGEAVRFTCFDCITRPLEREQVFRALFFAYARSRIRWPVGLLARTRNPDLTEDVQDERALKEVVT